MGIIVLPLAGGDPYMAMSRQDYINGKIDIEQFEAEVELHLSGELPQRLFGGLSPFPHPEMDTRGELR